MKTSQTFTFFQTMKMLEDMLVDIGWRDALIEVEADDEFVIIKLQEGFSYETLIDSLDLKVDEGDFVKWKNDLTHVWKKL